MLFPIKIYIIGQELKVDTYLKTTKIYTTAGVFVKVGLKYLVSTILRRKQQKIRYKYFNI